MIWLTLPLLIERLSDSCRVVMCWSSRQHATDFDGQLTGMAWVRRHGALLFLFWKLVLFSPSSQECFCWAQHFINIAKIFVVVSHWLWATRNSFAVCCLYHTSLTICAVRYCYSVAICQKPLWLPTWMQWTSNLLCLKSHTPSFLNGQKNDALLSGQDMCYTVSATYKIGFIIT
jgi:hypothetical protein